MGEVAVKLAQWLAKATFFIAVIVSIVIFISFINNYIVLGVNGSVLSDIYAFIQMWLPFNINVVLAWITIVATLYITYRLAYMAYNMVNSFIGK